MKIQPDLETFRARCREGNLVPVWGEVLADMETPVSAFRKFDDHPYAFLLESVEQGDRLGRYSFIGFDPETVISSRGGRVTVTTREGSEETSPCANVMEFLRDFMRRYTPVPDPALPPFVGGAVGFMSYDLVRSFERLPDSNPDDHDLPETCFMIADSLLIFDHVSRRLRILHNAHVGPDADAAYQEAVTRIRALATRLRAAPPATSGSGGEDSVAVVAVAHPPAVTSNMTPDEFKAGVDRAREYIKAGDAFQVVLSQRFERAFAGSPFDVYRALRAINPSPYMFYLRYGNVRLAGSSPEILVTVQEGKVRVRPIAGTRPRGRTDEEDRALERDLLADPKEISEHVMLIDLGRNDVGRVCTPGSVHVDDLMVIERYSHVMHIVSNVTGELSPDRDAYDALAATFPAGTLSGAPKIRAMEIIDELENVRRGPYGGACGWFGFNGNLDTCITIRTVLLKDGKAFVQAGAGIVADSDPEREFEETRNKARGMLLAVEMAEAGLD